MSISHTRCQQSLKQDLRRIREGRQTGLLMLDHLDTKPWFRGLGPWSMKRWFSVLWFFSLRDKRVEAGGGMLDIRSIWSAHRPRSLRSLLLPGPDGGQVGQFGIMATLYCTSTCRLKRSTGSIQGLQRAFSHQRLNWDPPQLRQGAQGNEARHQRRNNSRRSMMLLRDNKTYWGGSEEGHEIIQ